MDDAVATLERLGARPALRRLGVETAVGSATNG